ncbi:MAG: sodium:calcium antiporter [Nitrospirae bacterium]|nr:sodium:calcium antiporter [Nitrospirota bacterium]
MLLWVVFLLCTSVIVYSGTKLSKYGDIIAEKTGLGGTWIGVALMASVTSLPEFVTGTSSVTYAGVPDIAAGDVLGSCVFNMLILAILDGIQRPVPISARAHYGHVLTAGFGILLLSIAAAGLFLDQEMLNLGWIGIYSLVFVVIYFIAMRLVFIYEKRQIAAYVREAAKGLKYEKVSTRTAVTHYVINALFVIAAATFLPKIGEGLAELTGLGQTFVGNIFIAVSTSLPEVVVSVSAVRMGAIDMGIGNLFGSNIFNIFILAVDDFLFFKGPILAFADTNHIISALSAIAMTTVAIIGLTYRAEKKTLFLAWDSIGISLIYVVNLMLLYVLR